MTKHKLSVVLVALTLCCASTAALAQSVIEPVTAPNPETKPSKTAQDPRISDQTIVCKREDETGTRLGAKKICLTRGQWAAMAEASKQNTQHLQNSGSFH